MPLQPEQEAFIRREQTRIIPVYDRRGRASNPLFAHTVYYAVRASILDAINCGQMPRPAAIEALKQMVAGTFRDQNDCFCKIPERLRMDALRLVTWVQFKIGAKQRETSHVS